MAVKDRTTLMADIATALADNGSGAITPTVLRSVLTDVVDSMSTPGPWRSYTPVLSAYAGLDDPGVDPTMGNSTVEGAYVETGSLVVCNFRLVMGSTFEPGSGFYFISAPVQPAWLPRTVGNGEAIRGSVRGETRLFSVKTDPAWITEPSPTFGPLMMHNTSGFDPVGSHRHGSWAEGDILVGTAAYQRGP